MWSVMKMKQDNDLIDCTGMVYAEMKVTYHDHSD